MTYARRAGVTGTLILLPLAALLFLAGCSWGHPGSSPPQAPVSISLVPSSTTVALGQKVTITATVYDQSNQGVTWTLSPVDFGTLSNPISSTQVASDETSIAVTYTPPSVFSTPTTVTITAASNTNPNIAPAVKISASPIVIALSPPASQTVPQGGTAFVSARVANSLTGQGVSWSLSPSSGAGSLSSPTQLDVAYMAPATVSTPTPVTITATSLEDPALTANETITVLPSGGGLNTVVVNVDGGPVPGQPYPNGAFTTVTICNPGSTTACQTIDGVLVDTGSYGLRILQSQIPFLKLPALVDDDGNTLESCAAGVDGSYLWGPVSTADIYVGGEIALTSLVQVIASSDTITVPDGCSNGGTTNENTQQLLGANAILGVGPEPTDCTLAGVNLCDGSVQPNPPNLYYACPSTGCLSTDSPVIVAAAQQVKNPVPLFEDSNGVILQLPAVSGPQTALTGTLTFGIGTETNNLLGSATVFTTDSSGHITTVYNGQTLTSSFIDSGSNALYFPDQLPICTVNTLFYCPPSSTALSAVNQGATQGQDTVTFSVDNADSLFSTNPGYAVLGTLAGPEGTYNSCTAAGGASCTFDWGLPFFYGRTVFVAIDKQTVLGSPAPPWWAY